MALFRRGRSAADDGPRQSRWRSDRTHPELLLAARSVIVVSFFIGPGWLPEQPGSLPQGGVDEDGED
jgi:hypothetical protein